MDAFQKMTRDNLLASARDSFLEIEGIISQHRAINRIPTLAATDLFRLSSDLLEAIKRLDAMGLIEDAPALEESEPKNEA